VSHWHLAGFSVFHRNRTLRKTKWPKQSFRGDEDPSPSSLWLAAWIGSGGTHPETTLSSQCALKVRLIDRSIGPNLPKHQYHLSELLQTDSQHPSWFGGPEQSRIFIFLNILQVIGSHGPECLETNAEENIGYPGYCVACFDLAHSPLCASRWLKVHSLG
jgi:hypothetical protein